MSKMELWDRVCKTDPSLTKTVSKGGRRITSVDAYSQIMAATAEFGPYGAGWGFKSIELGYELLSNNLVTFKGVFFHPGGEFVVLNSMKLYIDNANSKLDTEFAKKLETDSLTKALSRLGFNADVFMGKFDDQRYVNELKEEKAKEDQQRKAQEFTMTWCQIIFSSKDAETLKQKFQSAWQAWDDEIFRNQIKQTYEKRKGELNATV